MAADFDKHFKFGPLQLTSSFGEPDARGALERPTVNGVGVNRVAVYKGAVNLGLTVYNIIL